MAWNQSVVVAVHAQYNLTQPVHGNNSENGVVSNDSRSLWERAQLDTEWNNNQWRENPLTLTIFCIIMSFLSVVGTLGNLYVVASFLLLAVLRKLQHAFVANLAVADLIITTVIMPINVVSTVYGPTFWYGKARVCEFIGTLCATLCSASVWSITAIAFERYMCICHYTLHMRLFTARLTAFWILCIWVMGHMIHLPNFVGWGYTSFVRDFYLCTAALNLASYSAFWAVFSVIIPTGVTFFAYLQIYLRVRVSQSGRNLIAGRTRVLESAAEPGVRVIDYRVEIRLVKTLFRIFVIFLISWFPLAVLFTINNGYSAPKWVNLSALILAHGNSATNSVVYFWMNSQFRESAAAFAVFFRCSRVVQPLLERSGIKGRPSDQEAQKSLTLTRLAKTTTNNNTSSGVSSTGHTPRAMCASSGVRAESSP